VFLFLNLMEVYVDPDVALKELRELTNKGMDLSDDEIERVVELFQGLDNWVSKGGYLPKEWRRG